MNQNDGMAKSERSELLRLVKARARVAKAELLAEFEQKLAAKYLQVTIRPGKNSLPQPQRL